MFPSNVDNDRQAVDPLPLSYALSLLSQFLPVPVHVFDKNGHYYDKFNDDDDEDNNVFKTDHDFRLKTIAIIKEQGVTIISQEKTIIYGGVQCLDELTLVVGPVSISDLDHNFCKLYALKHNARLVSPFRCDARKLASLILLIYSSITHKYLYLTDFLDKNFLDNNVIASTQKKIAEIINTHSITNKPHNPGSFEASIRFAITHGDIEELRRAHNSMYASMRGTLAPNELRSAKNLAIVDITIATRAAIDAGLGVEELYVISDAFILEAEAASTASEAAAIARACALRCTQMVAQSLKNKNKSDKLSPVVSRACDYIDRHVYERIDISSLSEKLHISPSYLSKLFKNEKQMTLGEFMRQRRIMVAKVLLTNTDKPISEIANLLNFNSQSHFGRIFLKLEGVSPAKYRHSHALRDVVF